MSVRRHATETWANLSFPLVNGPMIVDGSQEEVLPVRGCEVVRSLEFLGNLSGANTEYRASGPNP